MITLPSPQAALATVPGWQGRAAQIFPLPGGMNNRSYRVDYKEQRFVLRIAGSSGGSGTRDFSLELQIQHKAAALGIAPPIEYANPASGLLLTRYLEGRTWQTEDLQETRQLERLAALLNELHSLPLCGVHYDAVAAANAYLAALPEPMASNSTALRCKRIIAATGGTDGVVCCHNDLVAENVIDGSRLQLIDFEYARDNVALFDLASLIGWHHMAEKYARVLLQAYTGSSTEESWQNLQRQVQRFDAVQWLWLARRWSGAGEHSAQMQRVAARLG